MLKALLQAQMSSKKSENIGFLPLGPWSTRQSRLEVQRSKFSGPPLELEHPQVIGAGEHPLSKIFGPAGSQ